MGDILFGYFFVLLLIVLTCGAAYAIYMMYLSFIEERRKHKEKEAKYKL